MCDTPLRPHMVVGFSLGLCEQRWVCPKLPPLRMMAGLVRHFREAVCGAWKLVIANLCAGAGFQTWGLL